jgi:DNA-binding NtrC family response regulator
VYLPVYNADSWGQEKVVENGYEDVGGIENVMFVDDEPMLVSVFRQGLMKLGFKVEGFNDPRKAYEYFVKHSADVDIVITDTTMPYMNGIDLSEKMLAIKPKVPIIICTGFTTLISAEEAANKGISGFIMNPLKSEI